MQVREAGQGRTKDVRVESMHQETFKHRGGKDDARKDVAQRAKGVGTVCIDCGHVAHGIAVSCPVCGCPRGWHGQREEKA